jgi:hypothetical protein
MNGTYPNDHAARLDRGARWTAEADASEVRDATLLADALGFTPRPGTVRQIPGVIR